jgi:uncharacterized protein YicC (UPF0701 family)
VKINQEIVKAYINQLREISPNAEEYEYLKMAIRMPEAINGKPAELSEEEWQLLLSLVKEAVAKFLDFRKTEGSILQEELSKNLKNIEENLAK